MLPFIDIGFIKIPTYGITIASAYLVSYYYLIQRIPKYGFNKEIVENFMFYTVVWGFLGAKILYLLTFFNDFGSDFYERFINMFSINNLRSGFVFYGGFVSGGGFFYIYSKRKKINFLKIADFFAPAIPLAHSIGRLGCFFAGCCHGRPTDSIFGVRFTDPYCEVSPSVIGLKIHPTQIYESVGNFIIFLILNKLSKEKEKNNGIVIFGYFILYSMLRFTIEFFRGDERGWNLFFLSQSQLISLFVVIFSVMFLKGYIWREKK